MHRMRERRNVGVGVGPGEAAVSSRGPLLVSSRGPTLLSWVCATCLWRSALLLAATCLSVGVWRAFTATRHHTYPQLLPGGCDGGPGLALRLLLLVLVAGTV